jgi:hypothetical protein
MKRDIATGKFTLFCANWTMTPKRGAFEIVPRNPERGRRLWDRFDKLWP